MGGQCFVEGKDGQFRSNMAELLINFLEGCRISAQIDNEIFRGLEGDKQHPVEKLRKISTAVRCSEKYYCRYRIHDVLVGLIILSEQIGLISQS